MSVSLHLCIFLIRENRVLNVFKVFSIHVIVLTKQSKIVYHDTSYSFETDLG